MRGEERGRERGEEEEFDTLDVEIGGGSNIDCILLCSVCGWEEVDLGRKEGKVEEVMRVFS